MADGDGNFNLASNCTKDRRIQAMAQLQIYYWNEYIYIYIIKLFFRDK